MDENEQCENTSPSAHILDTSSSSLTSMSPPPSTTMTAVPVPPKKQTFFILLPLISEAEKKLYKMVGETSLKSYISARVDEIVGEYEDKGVLFYFARYKGGIVRKFACQPFTEQFPNLVMEYCHRKALGDLPPFNPSSESVHPLSRIRLTIDLGKGATGKRSRSSVTSSPVDSVFDSADDNEADYSNLYQSDADDCDSPQRGRRSNRFKEKRALPFSPKKTQSRRVFVVDSDFEDGHENESSKRVTRRSSRIKKGVRVNLDSEAYLEGEDRDQISDEYTDPGPKKMERRVKMRHVKVSRPAYGRLRDIEELEYDMSLDDPFRTHRNVCEKCQKGPAHELLLAFSKKSKGRGRKRKDIDEFEEFDDEAEHIAALGGWVRCLKCPVACHWHCLAASQRDEILKAARDRDCADWEQSQKETVNSLANAPGKRAGLAMNQTTEFICNACLKGGFCMGCMETIFMPGAEPCLKQTSPDSAPTDEGKTKDDETKPAELVFRCLTCKRIAHWEHLSRPSHLSSSDPLSEVTKHYIQNWLCSDCASYGYRVDKIIAWRPYPPNAVEPSRPGGISPNYKSPLPREYLVKWLDRSYRRVQWVPHMWLLSTHPGKLSHFITGGSKVDLVKESNGSTTRSEGSSIFEVGEDSKASSVKQGTRSLSTYDAAPDAELRIPVPWKTVDRILDLYLWGAPRRKDMKRKGKRKVNVIESDSNGESGSDDSEDRFRAERDLAFDQGEQPPDNSIIHVEDWEENSKCRLNIRDIKLVAWVFIKWDELGYDEATWDSPPRPSDQGYPAFERALQRFLDSRDVIVPRHSAEYIKKFEKRTKDQYRIRHILKDAADLDIGQDPKLRLMPFQVDGFNWLCNNWWNHQPCILADEMGLGKTVQVASFLGNIIMNFRAFPALVVVPNSTITNWVREFERWAPKLRVVPFYGEAKAREVIKKFELNHNAKGPHDTGAKFHVLVTTYESLLNLKDFTPVFKKQPRWEVVVVDEGQRLKSDSSLLFRRLNELNSIHRVIMTGTPLNNNIRELFNLMNFLDPNEWNDLENLEKEHAELTEELVKQLHSRLRPYFLRRIKSEVLQLPAKNEVIVPVSMAPLQKEVYRSILSHNLELLNGLTHPSTKPKFSAVKGRLNNVLMHLRKCLQHPYLYAEHIEPRGLSPKETHEKLIDGSAKLRLLKPLLPKLRERGHRVLLFSQFTIALDIVEDFLIGEGYKYLRLDGSTKNADRQKGMDEFNKPGSDVFIYLLTTRAGGVGINLFSADTVIIYDPDFNPHQDLQAIARAYRYGQQKTCLVFKLMVKDSAEERIIQVGKKKLVLDHLIVQKMDDEDEAGEDVQSILTYGAQALFGVDQDAKDITYTEQDIEKLIEKTEQEGEQEQVKEGMSFSFAKIWASDRDSLEEVQDNDQADSWAQTLQKMTEERDKLQAQEVVQSGRGVRRRAAALTKPNAYRDEPLKEILERRAQNSDGSTYAGSGDESNTSVGTNEDMNFEPPSAKRSKMTNVIDGNSSASNGVRYCGLCAQEHGAGLGECVMTDRSENLAQFREMLMLHADDEPWEQRIAAIEAIDRTLHRRGDLELIAGQPLHPLRKVQNLPMRRINTLQSISSALLAAGPANVQEPNIVDMGNLNINALSATNVPNGSEYQIGTQASPGSGKRPASPLAVQQSTKVKKAKVLPGPLCRICGQTFHLVKDCGVVTEGSQSISKAIERLENDTDPQMKVIVEMLKKLLRKQSKKEMPTSQDIIPISD